MAACSKLVDVARRQFLRGSGMAAAATVAAGAMGPAAAKAAIPAARVDYPSNRLGTVGELKTDEPVDIAYPDADSPGILIKLGNAAEGGVGPDGDIVAFSILCPHKGYPLHYVASDKTLNCSAHYSRFDCEKGGFEIFGHAVQNLPQFVLRVDDKGDIYAEGVDELIYGRTSNVLQG